MSDRKLGLILAEPRSSYQTESTKKQWLEVLVDCPGVEGLYTYSLPSDLAIEPGDIVSVPFGTQQTGGIAIRILESLPAGLDPDRIKAVEDKIAGGLFSKSYWQLLEKIAKYYCSELIVAIRVALPPGLLGRSTRRIKLIPSAIPPGAENFCSAIAAQILNLLKSQKDGDYSSQYINRKIRGASRGLRELIKRNWIETYLEPPQKSRPKQKKAVTLVADRPTADLTPRQREIFEILRQRGGELWLEELLKIAKTTSATVEALQKKDCVIIEQREILRLAREFDPKKDRPKQLNSAQEKAKRVITELQEYSIVLLHGVTGSGKTEVYLQAIAAVLQRGKSALVLVPEIGLTPQLSDRFRARFGDKVSIYHSKLSSGERYDTWRNTISGSAQIVIGTRSAIFTPLPNLGLIVLDEEHDNSFKQDRQAPTYNARTVAKWRAELENCPLVLGSATPSTESWVTATEEISAKSHYLSLPERIGFRPLPEVEIVDMRQELQRGNRSIFSRKLQSALTEMHANQQQGILFISRRGHSTFVSCRSCGYVMECPHCDVSLSYHYAGEGTAKLLRCHYCNHTMLQPSNCPECQSPYLKFFGSGTQKVIQELKNQFSQLRCIRYDSDTTRTKGAHRSLINSFANQEADLLVGTQMLTKGLDLEGVTLVGVIAADGLLHRSDYRATERAFSLLTQVAGRAGRGKEPGKVILQTYSPEHPVIEAVKSHDYDSFINAELEARLALNYPPYGKLILIKLSGLESAEVQQTAAIFKDILSDRLPEDCEILGPAPANIMRIARRYRWQILLKLPIEMGAEILNIKELRELCPRSVSMTIDVDPINIE
ncbi:MAG: primosomal protein N' [Prochloraceae cyanobacterium]|nr:primosomal protein N' [Prochloraceae cyanobacterium]